MVITLGVSERIKPGVDEIPGLVLLCSSFGVTWVGNKLGSSGGEVMGITLGVADIRKIGDENDQVNYYQVERLR